MTSEKIKEKIEAQRNSKNISWKILVYFKDFFWAVSLLKRRPLGLDFFIKKKDYSGYSTATELKLYLLGDFDLPKDYIIFHSSSYGFFSNFIGAIGYLDFCEKKGYVPNILFNSGNYLEKGRGLNWWNYYFSKISPENNYDKILTDRDKEIKTLQAFSNYARNFISLSKKNSIYKKYITIHKDILDEVNLFINNEFKDLYVIRCQIRGTDKKKETGQDLSIKTIENEINSVINGRNNYKIFLATDDSYYYSMLKNTYGDRLISKDYDRNLYPIHLSKKYQGYQIGREVLIDSLILSKSDYFIGTVSNVSHSVLIFNPNIKFKIIKEKK